MSKWWPVNFIWIGLLVLATCTTSESGMAKQCEMTSEILATKEVGPLGLEVFGSKILCIESEGDENLTPYTATVRIKNISSTPVSVGYSLDPLRSFRSKRVGSIYLPTSPVIEVNDCCGAASDPGPQEKTLQPNDELLVSSWSRHHDTIWNRVSPQTTGLTTSIPSEYVVRFDLSLVYDSGVGPVPVSETFDITFRAVPVVLENN